MPQTPAGAPSANVHTLSGGVVARAQHWAATTCPLRGALERLGMVRRVLEHEGQLILGLHALARTFEGASEQHACIVKPRIQLERLGQREQGIIE